MSRSDQVYRFAVGAENGARSAVYRVWAPNARKGKGDVYLGLRMLGEDFKVSLHDARGDLAAEGHFAISEVTRDAVCVESRFLAVWPRPAAPSDQSVNEFEILLPTSELHVESSVDEDTRGIEWIEPAPLEGAVLVALRRETPNEHHRTSTNAPNVLHVFKLGTGSRYLVTKSVLRRLPTEFITRVTDRKSRMLTRTATFELGALDYTDPSGRAVLGGVDESGRLAAFVEVHLAHGGQKRPNKALQQPPRTR